MCICNENFSPRTPGWQPKVVPRPTKPKQATSYELDECIALLVVPDSSQILLILVPGNQIRLPACVYGQRLLDTKPETGTDEYTIHLYG